MNNLTAEITWNTVKGHGLEDGDVFSFAGKNKADQTEAVDAVITFDTETRRFRIFDVNTNALLANVTSQNRIYAAI